MITRTHIRTALTIISLVILVAVATPYIYKYYDQWRWSTTTDTDLIQSISGSLPASAANGRKVVVISNVDESQYRLLKGYAGISPEADFILEPRSLKDLARMLMILKKGKPISRLTFFGHGVLKQGSVALKFMNYDQGDSGPSDGAELTAQSFIDLQKTHGNLPSAFSADAQVVFFNCFAGRDDLLMQAAGEAFLSLRGGKVVANRNKVTFDISYGGDIGSEDSAIILRMDRPLRGNDWLEKEF